MFEGGHRVRAFINFPKDLKPAVYDGMFHSVDWLPTLLSAATGQSVELDGIDGMNQWNSIKLNQISRRDWFIYNIDPYGNKENSKIKCDTATESIR